MTTNGQSHILPTEGGEEAMTLPSTNSASAEIIYTQLTSETVLTQLLVSKCWLLLALATGN